MPHAFRTEQGDRTSGPLYRFPKIVEIWYDRTMMPVIEVVWRHLLVGAREGHRRWPSVTALAGEMDIPVSTAHRSLEHPTEIGAVSVGTLDGLQVLDPARLLVLFAAHRRVSRDILSRFRVAVPAGEVERLATSSEAVLGGFGAVVVHLHGVNPSPTTAPSSSMATHAFPTCRPRRAGRAPRYWSLSRIVSSRATAA
jgi:hypothetical protein